MGCDLERINGTWSRALANPIEPRVVRDAPCQEIVIEGSELDQPGKGLDSLPIPISTPGWDIAPFTTLSQYITKDPDNGIQNMGIYRGQRSEEHTSELQSRVDLVCRLLLEKKKKTKTT